MNTTTVTRTTTFNNKNGPHKWVNFSATLLGHLPPGRYCLREKLTITSPVAGVEKCSLQEQLMFAAVDTMERDLLETVIQQKVRQLNMGKAYVLVSVTGPSLTSPGIRKQILVVFDNKYPSRVKEITKDLGGLLTMAYDQILIPTCTVPNSLTRSQTQPSVGMNESDLVFETIFLDHSYCNIGNESDSSMDGVEMTPD